METLKKRRDFLSAAKGRRWVTPGMVVQAVRRRANGEAGDQPRIGYTVTKRVGNAVTRNRVKRRLRAAAHKVFSQHAKAQFDYVLIGRIQTIDRPFQCLLDDLRLALIKLHAPSRPKHLQGRTQRRPKT